MFTALRASIVGLALLMVIAGIAKFPALILVGVLSFLAAAIYGIVAVQIVTPAKIDEQFCWMCQQACGFN